MAGSTTTQKTIFLIQSRVYTQVSNGENKRVWGEERKKKYLKKIYSRVWSVFFFEKYNEMNQATRGQPMSDRARARGWETRGRWLGGELESPFFFASWEVMLRRERERERERRLTISRSPITPFRETTRSHGRHDQTRHTETTTDSWEDNRPTVYTPFFIILHGIVTLSHKNVFFKRNNKMRFNVLTFVTNLECKRLNAWWWGMVPWVKPACLYRTPPTNSQVNMSQQVT